jgi:hypothetical protein
MIAIVVCMQTLVLIAQLNGFVYLGPRLVLLPAYAFAGFIVCAVASGLFKFVLRRLT